MQNIDIFREYLLIFAPSITSFQSLGMYKNASTRFFQLLNKNMFKGTLKIRF